MPTQNPPTPPYTSLNMNYGTKYRNFTDMSIQDMDKKIQFEQLRRTGYFMKKVEDYRTRYNIFNRTDKDKDPNAFPWMGASDQRIYKVESEIRKAKAMKVSALFKSRMFFEPMSQEALEKAKLCEEFWHWMFHMRIRPMREVILAADILEQDGLCVIHTTWDMQKTKLMEEINPDYLPPQLIQAIQQGQIQLVEQILPFLQQIYPDATDEELIKAWDDYTSGVPMDKIKLPRIVYTKAQPHFAACSTVRDIIIPSYTAELNDADWIVRIYRYSQQALVRDSFMLDYDQKLTQKIIDECFDQYGNAKTREITTTQDQQYKTVRDQRYGITSDAREGLIIYDCYERVYDKDGVAKFKVVTYCPAYQYACLRKVDLDYPHGEYPFVELESEVVDRNVHAARGKPRFLKWVQDELKIQTDSRIDRTTYGTLPTVIHPMGQPPGELGPASTYGYLMNPQEIGFLSLPPNDGTGDRVQAQLNASVDELFGTVSPGANAQGSKQPVSSEEAGQENAEGNMLVSFDLEYGWMAGWARAICQAWALTQAFLPESIWFKAVGVPNGPPLRASVDDIQGKYVIVPCVSLQDIMPEKALKVSEQILQIAMNDHTGAVDPYEALQIFFMRLDVKAARRVLRPQGAAQQNEVKEEQDMLTKLSVGIPQNVPPNVNPQLRLQVAQQFLKQPDIRLRLKNDKGFGIRIQTHLKQLEFVASQMKNAQVGKMGATFPQPYTMEPMQPSDTIKTLTNNEPS